MPVQNMPAFRPKAAVSVTAMAKAVGLSRSQFYAYMKRGVFPWPVYSLATRRPFFTAEMQQEILEVRQSGIGCNGEYVLFYERRTPSAPSIQPPSRRAPNAGLVEGLKSLGLSNVTQTQVAAAVAAVYPNGTDGVDEAVVIRSVYRHLRRLNLGG